MGLTSLIQPTGSGDSGAVGEVDSITNSDGTLTISPTTGAAVASLNLGNANVWTALQTFAAGALLGSDDTLSWGDAVGGGTADTTLRRSAAGLLATGVDTRLLIDQTVASQASASISLERSGLGFYLRLFADDSGGLQQIRSSGQLRIFTADTSFVNFDATLQWVTTNLKDIGISDGTLSPRSVYARTSFGQVGANAQAMSLRHLTELTTIAAAATTDTTIQIPANSLVMGVTVRVTTVIPTAATFDVGVAGATTRYGSGISTAANTTNASPGTTNPTIYASAVSVRITPNLTPADNTGRLRVTIHYLDLTAPTG